MPKPSFTGCNRSLVICRLYWFAMTHMEGPAFGEVMLLSWWRPKTFRYILMSGKNLRSYLNETTRPI